MFISLLLVAVVLSKCASYQTHVEWRQLSQKQRSQYMGAISCLRNSPATIKVKAGMAQHQSRWEDFAYAYQQAYEINGLQIRPAILPTHRAFLAVFDNELRTNPKCKYTGPLPYWDWSRDVNVPEQSEIWEWFGRNGCITIPGIGQWTTTGPNSRCVRRYSTKFDDPAELAPESVQLYLTTDQYESLNYYLQNKLMKEVLESIGGDMGTKEWAANDPLYYLILRNNDRLWSIWQAKNGGKNAAEYGGYIFGLKVMATPADFLYLGEIYTNTLIVSDVLSIHGGGFHGLMCYRYSTPPLFPSSREIKAKIQQWLRNRGPNSRM